MENVVARIQGIVTYDPDTGEIYWRVRGHGRRMGVQCGCVKKDTRVIKIDGTDYTAARIAWIVMTGEVPKFIINHKDGRSINVRWDNLERGDNGISQRNSPKTKKTRTGIVGVSPHNGGFEAYIGDGSGGKVHLGKFDDIERAKDVRRRAEKERGYGRAHGFQSA